MHHARLIAHMCMRSGSSPSDSEAPEHRCGVVRELPYFVFVFSYFNSFKFSFF